MGFFVLTGASSPLGKKLTSSFLATGYKGLLIVRDLNKSICLQNSVKDNVKIMEADLSNEHSVEEVCKEIGNLDVNVFIHLAADASADYFHMSELQKTFSINVFSGWRIADACIEKMRISGGGRIVFVGSVGHKFGGKTDRSGYAGSKYLLEFFPKQFRECAQHDILVNTIRIGVMVGGTNHKTGLTEQDLITRIKKIPCGRAVNHDEVVANIQFLCSTTNKSIHNTTIACTGGE